MIIVIIVLFWLRQMHGVALALVVALPGVHIMFDCWGPWEAATPTDPRTWVHCFQAIAAMHVAGGGAIAL